MSSPAPNPNCPYMLPSSSACETGLEAQTPSWGYTHRAIDNNRFSHAWYFRLWMTLTMCAARSRDTSLFWVQWRQSTKSVEGVLHSREGQGGGMASGRVSRKSLRCKTAPLSSAKITCCGKEILISELQMQLRSCEKLPANMCVYSNYKVQQRMICIIWHNTRCSSHLHTHTYRQSYTLP